MNARVDRARELLGSTSLSVKENCLPRGFTVTPRMLSRCFLEGDGEKNRVNIAKRIQLDWINPTTPQLIGEDRAHGNEA